VKCDHRRRTRVIAHRFAAFEPESTICEIATLTLRVTQNCSYIL
jgi:hypothetical protein